MQESGLRLTKRTVWFKILKIFKGCRGGIHDE
jgi:hypothetical protein